MTTLDLTSEVKVKVGGQTLSTLSEGNELLGSGSKTPRQGYPFAVNTMPTLDLTPEVKVKVSGQIWPIFSIFNELHVHDQRRLF